LAGSSLLTKSLWGDAAAIGGSVVIAAGGWRMMRAAIEAGKDKKP
jgi:hypothetical protein